jgi:hypothetical protein
MIGLISPLLWIAGCTFALFAFLDSVASPAISKKLYDYVKLRSGAINTLPQVAANLFEVLFGPKHFSARCFLSSLTASIISISGMYILRTLLLLLAVSPAPSFLESIHFLLEEIQYPFNEIVRESFFISLFANLIFDYISLFKTRLIIKYLLRKQFSITLGMTFVICDFVFSFFLFQAYYIVFYIVSLYSIFLSQHVVLPAADPKAFFVTMEILILLRFLTYPGYPAGTFYKFVTHSNAIKVILLPTIIPVTLVSVFFYASVMPSLWLWLFVFAGLISQRIAPIFSVVMPVLNFEQKPLRIIGLVLAALIVFGGVFVLGVTIVILQVLMWLAS